MQSKVVPASEAVFKAVVYRNGQVQAAPQDDAAWAALRARARELANIGTDMTMVAPPDRALEWVNAATSMTAAALETMQAADKKDAQEVLAAGGRIYQSCTSCHAAFAPDADNK